MDKLKLKWKIFAFLLGFCALLLVILWLFQTTLLSDMYKFTRKREIENAIRLVEKNIDSPNLQTVLKQLENEKEIYIVASNQSTPVTVAGPVISIIRNRVETISEVREFTLGDGRAIYLTFNAVITPVDATVSTLRLQLYIITGIMIILAVVIALVLAKRVSKPIEEINSSAKVLAGGNYDTNFNGKGFLEINELSETLNTAAAELSKVEALRRELLANVSHDLRTPLSLIYSYAEMIHDFPSEITEEQTQVIMTETKRLTTLVNDILDVSKLENGKLELCLSNFNITESVENMTGRVAKLVEKDGYEISFVYDKEIFVNADEVKLSQVVYNLLINAINYSYEDKRIKVRQAVNGDTVRIEVSDMGEGISEEDLPYIWDRYYKIDKIHRRAVTGTGLGLSIVKKIIDLHGGYYGVESVLDRGSTFWFSLKIRAC